MEDISDQLKSPTSVLKNNKAGVTIRQRRNKLCLRSVLPAKDGSPKLTQYDIPTGCDANAPGLKRCLKLAQKLAAEKSLGSFDWSNWLTAPKEAQSRAEVQTASQTVEAWVQRFKVDWWDDKTLDTTAQKSQAKRSWTAYQVQFNRIPNAKDLLTVDLLVEVAKTTAPGSKPRHEFCQRPRRYEVR